MPNGNGNGNGSRVIGRQGTLTSLGLDIPSKRRKPRKPTLMEQTQELQQEGVPPTLQERAEDQGRLGTADPSIQRERKQRKRVRNVGGDYLRRQGGGY